VRGFCDGLAQVLEMLSSRGRLSCRALKRQFSHTGIILEELKKEE
jgi:hypothetical protein